MKTIRNWVLTQINRIRNYWNKNHERIGHDVRRFYRGLNRITRNMEKLIFIGIIINVVSNYFYPDFPERFPTIYSWFDGWLQLGEFVVKAALEGVYSFFTGNWSKFWTEYKEAFRELLQQFVNWLATLHF